MTAPAATMSLHDACETARSVTCGECDAPRQAPCLRGDLGAKGYHVARFAQAWCLGLISGPDLAVVLDAAVVFTSSTVVYDEEVPS